MKDLNFAQCIQPPPRHAVLRLDDWFVWGASMIRTANGICHMLFARWPKEHGFNAWATHSEIAHATARDPLGPYHVQGVALGARPGAWDADNAHNPTIVEFDGVYYLYYTGNYGDGTFWDHRNHQRVGVAVADHPSGPWSRFDAPLLDVTPNGWDHLLTSSPTVTRNDAGTYFLVYKGVSAGEMPFGGRVRIGVATSRHPLGPFEKQPHTIFDHPTARFPTDDNFIWFQGNRFYAIVKDYGGYFSGCEAPALVLFQSQDGLHWRLAAHALVSRFRIQWEDGAVTENIHRFEQPQLWMSDGQPAVLFLAVKERDDSINEDRSYNIHIPLCCAKGDT
jgi:hypothetical protein